MHIEESRYTVYADNLSSLVSDLSNLKPIQLTKLTKIIVDYKGTQTNNQVEPKFDLHRLFKSIKPAARIKLDQL